MKVYDVYVGYGGRPDAEAQRIHLENFALGLGLPGFTLFNATGGWRSDGGDLEFEPVWVFRFILPNTGEDSWGVRAFAAEAKAVLEQQAILVTVTDVAKYYV